MSARPSMPSRRLLGRYEIVAQIAKGGMGTVYLGRLEGVGGFRRLVAIKLVHPHLADEAQFAAMLLDEARLASQLHHPNVVGVVDVDESPLGLYIVMEYLPGGDCFLLLQVPPLLRLPRGAQSNNILRHLIEYFQKSNTIT